MFNIIIAIIVTFVTILNPFLGVTLGVGFLVLLAADAIERHFDHGEA